LQVLSKSSKEGIEMAESILTAGARGPEMDQLVHLALAFKAVCGSDCVNVSQRDIAGNGSDVLPQVQKLIDRISGSGGGKIYFPAGLYGFRGSLQLRKDVKLIGDGEKTILRQLAPNKPLVVVDNASFTVVSDLTIDQSSVTHTAGQSSHGVRIAGSNHVILKNLTINAALSSDGQQRGDGIYIRDAGTNGGSTAFVVIYNVSVSNASRNGIAIVGGQNVWIENVRLGSFSGNANASLDLEPEANDTVQKVTVLDLTVQDEIVQLFTNFGYVHDILLKRVQAPTTRITFSGNVHNVLVENAKLAGLNMESGHPNGAKPREIYVKNTVVSNGNTPQLVYLDGQSVTFDGCELVGGIGAAIRDAGMTERVTIRNSVIRGSAGNGIAAYYPEKVEIENCRILNHQADGIHLGTFRSKIKQISITDGCIIQSNGRNGILLDAPLAQVEVSGNTITGNKSNGLMVTNCLAAAIKTNMITNNLKGILVSDYDGKRSIDHVVIQSNQVYNPGSVQTYGIAIIDGPGYLNNVIVTNNRVYGHLKANIEVSPTIPSQIVSGNQMT
jgi:hypothetical protein